jgi:hypothetical protein
VTDSISRLFSDDLVVVNLGLASFGENLRRESVKVVQMDWRPEGGGKPEMLVALDSLCGADDDLLPAIRDANAGAVERLLGAKPSIIGIGRAGDTIPGMRRDLFLHAGPPVTWDRMCGPMRGAVIGGILYEGLAKSPTEAEKLAASGAVAFEPCHDHQAVGPMAGIVTASMPVWIVENTAFGNRAFSTLNEGLGKVLRYGAFGDEVITRLRWMETVLAPTLSAALELHGPVDLQSLIAQALQMGDEVHNRNRAATSLLIRALAPHLVCTKAAPADIAEVLRFLNGNDHFFLNISMAACKSALDPTLGIPGCTMISTMARNGTDFGIRVSGTGDRWFTAPAPMVEGLYLPGFNAADAAPDIGDSVITETAGLGGFAMAAAPAIVQFVGGNASRALAYTREMYNITLSENPAYRIPALDFRGTPAGIELTRVVATGIVPVVNTGIAHREPGIGMVGAGLVKPPIGCFEQALAEFARKFQDKTTKSEVKR